MPTPTDFESIQTLFKLNVVSRQAEPVLEKLKEQSPPLIMRSLFDYSLLDRRAIFLKCSCKRRIHRQPIRYLHYILAGAPQDFPGMVPQVSPLGSLFSSI